MRYLKMVLFVLITLFNSISAFAENESALAIEYLETQESLDASIVEREIIREQPINIMADTFTEDELKAINDFYKSKYGITDADICIIPGTLEAYWCQYE
jgi:hypothetical protein